MSSQVSAPSARRAELLELAYQYAMQHGRTDLSLRPMAAAVGSSPRVLLYLFGSKDGLIRALLDRARSDEQAMLAELRQKPDGLEPDGLEPDGLEPDGLAEAGTRIWTWLSDDTHRPLLRLWLDCYARSLSQPDGPWAGFGRSTVADWLDLLAEFQPASRRSSAAGLAERTLLLAALRGGLLDLLATDDAIRTTAAVRSHLAALHAG